MRPYSLGFVHDDQRSLCFSLRLTAEEVEREAFLLPSKTLILSATATLRFLHETGDRCIIRVQGK